jgi:primosomal protein N' (replication factor Y)
MLTCEVLVKIKALEQPFTYALPPETKVHPGALVRVPFGKRMALGYVLKLSETEKPNIPLKPLASVLWDEPERSAEIMALAGWMQERYACSKLQALSTLLPQNILAAPLSQNALLQTPAALKPYFLSNDAPWYYLYDKITSLAPQTFLLDYGEGEGWLDLYLALIQETLARNRTVLILMPEIYLTRANLEFFKTYLGGGLSILHSRLSAKTRALEWHKLKAGKRRVVLGSRSAVFAPLTNLGLIIMHNEEDPAYKEESQPRYHSRQIALQRAAYYKAKLVLNSFTPAVESYYWALQNSYHYLPTNHKTPPKFKIVEYFREFKHKELPALGRYLKFKMTKALLEGQKVLLFLNRKGFAGILRCKDCGWLALCPKCRLPLRLYVQKQKLLCPLCGEALPNLDSCPQCRGLLFSYQSIGLEKVELEVRQAFREAKVLRWDKENAPQEPVWEEADIIIGTQILLPYLDFKQIAVIGVISADTWLHLPNFRAAEFMWQSLGALSFKALPQTEIIIQSFNPEHYVLQALRSGEPASFYQTELEQRKELQFPPFAHLISLSFKGPAEEFATRAAQTLENPKEWTLTGPLCYKDKDELWSIILKGKKVTLMTAALSRFLKDFKLPQTINIIIDVDPL